MIVSRHVGTMGDTIEHIANEVPCYEMRFDRSGAIVPVIEALAMAE